MSWATGLMVYFVIWWTVLFAVLPLGVRRAKNPGKGQERGAPERPDLVRKAIITSLVAAVLWIIFFFLNEADVFSFRRMEESSMNGVPAIGRMAWSVFEGRDLTRATPYERARAGLSLKFQITAVPPELSVYDNVLLATQSGGSLPRPLLSSSRRALDEEVSGLLERFRLVDRADVLAGELSHGQQQWLEIAVALALKPRLLMLDEPTEGVWVGVIEEIADRLKQLSREMAVVLVEQHIELALEFAGHAYVMDRGHIALEGPAASVKSDPQLMRHLAP